jgi:hypothetical protein
MISPTLQSIYPNNLPYIGHTRNPCCLSFSFQFLFKELGIVGCVGDGGMAWGDVIVYMNEWMNEKRMKWSKRFLGQVSSPQFLPSFSEISSCLVVSSLWWRGSYMRMPTISSLWWRDSYMQMPTHSSLWWRGSSYILMPTGS